MPRHGGYRKLKSFQVAQLVYDVTVRFCDLYLEKRSRTHDQMVQAARSGVQNIAEGSQASGTSKKAELKLTNVARASLEELRLDYEDFLRQRDLPLWPHDHPALSRFKALRCSALEHVRAWAESERKQHGLARTNTDDHGRGKTTSKHSSVAVRGRPCWWPMRRCRCSIFAAACWTARLSPKPPRSNAKAVSRSVSIACASRAETAARNRVQENQRFLNVDIVLILFQSARDLN
jgi:four helix bundle protein